MDERRHKHRDRYRRLHVDDHNHGGNDINDCTGDHDCGADNHIHGCYNDDPCTHDVDDGRTDYDVAGDEHEHFRSAVIDYIANHDDPTNHGYDDPIYLAYVRAVYDAAARVLGTGGATDKPTNLDPALYAYLVERARYDAGISDNATIFAPLRDTARTWLASNRG